MVAKSQLSKWGNSLAIRIPKELAEKASFHDGDVLVLEVEDVGRLSLKTENPPATFEELVAAITPENLHDVEEWNGPVGREAW